MSISKTQLGHAIRQIREMRGYSQSLLAQKTGLQPNTVALIERGERGVSLDAVNKLAAALAIPAGCLTMLGTTKIKGDSESTALVKSMQELIRATLFAQTCLQEKEETSHSQALVAKKARKPKTTAKEGMKSKSKKFLQRN
jgi:transcriptional regulator with XRE-family HTH domain